MRPEPRLAWALLLALASWGSGCSQPAPPAPDDDDDDSAGGSFEALHLYGAFGGDASLGSSGPDGEDRQDDLLGLLGSDWAIQVEDGDPWLLGRYGTDIVRRYNGLDFSAPALEFSVGSPSNPQAVSVCGGKLFVTRYGLVEGGQAGGDVAVYDLGTGGPLGRVDLADHHEGSDGTPEPSTLVRVGDLLYVALNRLDRDQGWTADPVGHVVEIDCLTQDVTDWWETLPNPGVGPGPGGPGQLLVQGKGGIQTLDLDTGEVTLVLDEDSLGFTVSGLASSPSGTVLVTEDPDQLSTTWCVDPDTWELTAVGTSSSVLWGIESDPAGRAWTLWRDHWATPGVDPGGFAIVDPGSCEEVTPSLVPLPADPIDLAFQLL